MCPPSAHGSIKPVLYHFRGFTNLIEAGFLLPNKTACVGYFTLGAYRLFDLNWPQSLCFVRPFVVSPGYGLLTLYVL